MVSVLPVIISVASMINANTHVCLVELQGQQHVACAWNPAALGAAAGGACCRRTDLPRSSALSPHG